MKIIQKRGESSYNFNPSVRIQLWDGTHTNDKLFSKKIFYGSFATVCNGEFDFMFITVIKQTDCFNCSLISVTFVNAPYSQLSLDSKFFVSEIRNHLIKWFKGACLHPLQLKTHITLIIHRRYLYFNFKKNYSAFKVCY